MMTIVNYMTAENKKEYKCFDFEYEADRFIRVLEKAGGRLLYVEKPYGHY